MKRALAGFVVLAVAAAWAAGFWPERLERRAAEARLYDAERQLAEAEARLRVADLLGRMLTLSEAVDARNFGAARRLSSRFFDAVRQELAESEDAKLNDALEQVLGSRDDVTAALSQSLPETLELLRPSLARLRTALGHPPVAAPRPPPEAAPPEAASPEPPADSPPPLEQG